MIKQKKLTKKQIKKADKVISLLKELSDENVTFYMNSTPTLEIGFLRNANSDWTMEEFADFINDEEECYYTTTETLRLESYGF